MGQTSANYDSTTFNYLERLSEFCFFHAEVRSNNTKDPYYCKPAQSSINITLCLNVLDSAFHYSCISYPEVSYLSLRAWFLFDV